MHTERVLSRPGGDVSFAYNADAAPGDEDVVVARPVSADEDPDAQARWCADVRTDGDQASVVAAEERDAQSVRVSWTEPAAVEAVGAGYYAGSVLAHDLAQGTVEVLTAGGPLGVPLGRAVTRPPAGHASPARSTASLVER